MRSFQYKKINAFTSGKSLGNPAAFIAVDDDVLTDSEMLQIAKEQQGYVSEVIFVSRDETGKLNFTYYSSECEVSFCGHGTIATMYELVKNDPELLGMAEIEIGTNRKGNLTVYNYIQNEDAVYMSKVISIPHQNPF